MYYECHGGKIGLLEFQKQVQASNIFNSRNNYAYKSYAAFQMVLGNISYGTW